MDEAQHGTRLGLHRPYMHVQLRRNRGAKISEWLVRKA